jgi:hypothetical protein
MFNIGDTVFHANYSMGEQWVTCPDCFGTKTLKVILGDGTEYVIDCAGCSHGCTPPSGQVKRYAHSSFIEEVVISGVQQTDKGYEYRSYYHILSGENVFATREEAEARAAELITIKDQEEQERLQRKEKDTRSWAWHVHYHRDKIRRAKTEIEYSEKKLGIAITKAKGKE